MKRTYRSWNCADVVPDDNNDDGTQKTVFYSAWSQVRVDTPDERGDHVRHVAGPHVADILRDNI